MSHFLTALVGLLIVLLNVAWVGTVVTLVVLVIRALLKYVGG